MEAVKLGSKKALMIKCDSIRNDIKTKLISHLELKFNEKKFDILNFNDLEKLKNFSLFSLSTNGNKFWLFLTTYNDRKYCVLINPKKDQMYLVRYRFDTSLFSDTVFEGEAIKNNKGDKWYFLINDISIYKGIKIKNTSFSQRQETISSIMEKEHKLDDALNPMILIQNPYIETEYLKHFLEEQMKCIPFKVSGIYFKSDDNTRKDLLFLLDENKKMTSTMTVNKKKISVVKTDVSSKNVDKIGNIDETNSVSILWVKKTDFPDVYEISKKNNDDRIGFASIPDMKTSQYMNSVLTSIDGSYFECYWDDTFSKWRPIKLASNIKVI